MVRVGHGGRVQSVSAGGGEGLVVEQPTGQVGVAQQPAWFLGIYEIDGELWGSHGATLEAREEGMPNHLNEVAHDGMGGTIALDASQPDADGEYPVVVWETPDQPVLELLAPSFGAYALDVFQQVAERKNG
ncbi:hypothetical protein ADK70_27215 [Streptomyces rimosus subsp. pseudoverticillatus]|uniref:hypothetical protein n=1 Tax=Streptomyces rimosus TaxID=1927 RepID=UPI0006B27ACF|nr:hypothetical protein [Streptomyces rimosus]KOT80935.1 hypothetical protein ADK70_27215 [Streptomyces rimosus subsp. pseudoverticillatus]